MCAGLAAIRNISRRPDRIPCRNCKAAIRSLDLSPNPNGTSKMERKKASDFPQGLLNLFDQYVHGAISRRAFLDGAQNFAVGGVTASALFEMLKPNYAPGRRKCRNRTAALPPSRQPFRHRRAMAASTGIWFGQATPPDPGDGDGELVPQGSPHLSRRHQS